MQAQVTVFGGGGFVGRHAVRALAKAGYRIRVAVRRPHLAPEVKVMGDVGQIEVVQANLRNAPSVAAAVAGSDVVINLVGILYAAGRQTFSSVQAEGAATVAKAAAAAGVKRLVQVSAIGADAGSPSAYARSKAEGEAAVRAAFPGAVILRPSVVFGPEDEFFNRFAAMASVSPVLPLIGGGETKFQPVFVGDVAKAIVAASGRDDLAGQTFELGGPEVLSYRQVLEYVVKETGRARPLVPVPWPLAALIGAVGDVQSALIALPPVLTSDQVKLLRADNVATGPGLTTLGIEATAIENVVPTYLWRFRNGGQFYEALEN